MSTVARCKAISDLAQEAAQWATSSEERLGVRAEEFRTNLLRTRDIADQLAIAAERPSAAGVFGGSQVGKSYLIGALARGNKRTLEIKMGDATCDFLEDINPGGGRESTGVVTRFTIEPGGKDVAGYPVRVRLLSQMDIVKIFANSYFLDFDQNDENAPTNEEIQYCLATARGRAASSNVDNLSSRDIDWLHAYLWERFRSRETIKALERGQFWSELEELAPRLSVADRTPLFALLWGQLDRFSEIYTELCGVLKSLDFTETACCEIQALIPRESSIIDAYKLRELANPDTAKIGVQSSSGRVAQVPLPLLTALVAELELTLTSPAHAFLEHTDVLDFPGARSRHNWTKPAEKLSDPEKLAEVILRGKVAYLFERYTSEFSLNALVLCVRPGNQEVRSISDYVTPWIEAVHGRTPKFREDQAVALFLTLTFFDERFIEKAGGENSWHDAVHTAVSDLFGNTSDWVDHWTPNQPFNNVFWGRNPGFVSRGLMTYDQDNRETGILDQDRVNKFLQSYLDTDLVRRHIKNPEDSFNAAFELNDGGVTYLANQLGKVCTPDLKDKQILARLNVLLQDMKSDLTPLYIPENGSEAVLVQRRQAIRKVIRGLRKTLEMGKFGHLLNALAIEHEEVVAAMMTIDYDNDVKPEPNARSVTERQISEILPDDLFDPEIDDDADDAMNEMPETATGIYAQRAIDAWATKVSRISSDNDLAEMFGLKREDASEIAQELINGIATNRVKLRMRDVFDQILLPTDAPRLRSDKIATVAVEILSDYALHLGQTWKPEQDRVQNGLQQPVFKRVERPEKLTRLEPETHSRALKMYGDWCTSLDALVRLNATGGGNQDANAPWNKALGKILEKADEETPDD
ncbi:MAG: virulence factor SrfC family protein [Hyphomicrobiales bacterium]